QNWGVLMASRAVTLVIGNWWSVVGDRVAAGRRDVGCQSSGGTRTVKTPNIMKAKYSAPIVTNVGATPCAATRSKRAMSMVASGEAIIAPPPNPMMAMPVAIPGLSGNHLM